MASARETHGCIVNETSRRATACIRLSSLIAFTHGRDFWRPQRRLPRALVIEDADDTRQLFAAELDRAGFAVSQAAEPLRRALCFDARPRAMGVAAGVTAGESRTRWLGPEPGRRSDASPTTPTASRLPLVCISGRDRTHFSGRRGASHVHGDNRAGGPVRTLRGRPRARSWRKRARTRRRWSTRPQASSRRSGGTSRSTSGAQRPLPAGPRRARRSACPVSRGSVK